MCAVLAFAVLSVPQSTLFLLPDVAPHFHRSSDAGEVKEGELYAAFVSEHLLGADGAQLYQLHDQLTRSSSEEELAQVGCE